MMRQASIALTLIFLISSTALGQEWARKMFRETEHDFGTVARGAKVEHEFVLSNIFLEDVHIASVRTSCSCTTPRIKNAWLKTYEKGAIVATYNTRAFRGRKGATITVTFDKPYYAQVQLHVKGYIRSDVVFDSSSVQLGDVDQGSAVAKKTGLTYAGRSDWRVVGVRSANPHISGKVVETGRGYGRVTYDVLVNLDESAPTGYINDQLMLVTNDRRMTQIPLRIEGRVTSAVTVSPSSLFMGVVEPGEKVTKNIVVRGKEPFRILSVTSDDGSFEIAEPTSDEAKSVHLVPVTFEAGEDEGKVSETIQIETDLYDLLPELGAHAVISDPQAD